GFGDADGHFLRGALAVELHPPGDACLRAFLELYEVVADEGFGDFDERDRARQAAVVPPVCDERGDGVAPSRVVNADDQRVVALAHAVRDLEVEGREAAFVAADLFAVEVNVRGVVGRAEVKEEARALFARVVEGAPVPDAPLVEEESLALRVPVAGHVERLAL